MTAECDLHVWFPVVETGTGTSVFTRRLVDGLRRRGVRADVSWLPLRAEYAPWAISKPALPAGANIVHVNTWLHTRFLPPRLRVVATVHHAVHDRAAQVGKSIARTAYHRFWFAPNERRVLRRASRVVAVSRYAAEAARHTLCDVPMDVIHNGVDVDRFVPGNRRRASGEPFRLLYVGGWTSLKGVDLLPPIMRELGGGFELRYTGGGRAAQHRLQMPANAHDIGWLDGEDAVVAAMQDVDALLFPSRSEGFGLVAAEAMSCGLPVIATRGSSLVEVIEDGVTGILCSTDDVSAFADAARSLAGEGDRAPGMRHAARARAVGRFSLDAMVDAYIRVYRESLSA